jgi:hypothetical protein
MPPTNDLIAYLGHGDRIVAATHITGPYFALFTAHGRIIEAQVLIDDSVEFRELPVREKST